MPQFEQHPSELENQEVFELPPRPVLSLIDPSLTNGLLSYANASQSTPTTQGSTTSNPLFGHGLSTVTSAAQTAHTAPNGGTIQNGSPSSTGLANTSGL
jgi:hypothetical protein